MLSNFIFIILGITSHVFVLAPDEEVTFFKQNFWVNNLTYNSC